MIKISSIKRYVKQIIAITEKNFYLELRIRATVLTRFLSPIIQLFILIFIFNVFFNIKKGYSIGYWDANNFTLFLLIAFCVNYSRPILLKYKNLFMQEKYWKTLSAIMVAPVNRFTLLFGTLLSEFLISSLPLIIIFVILFILYPIPLIFVFLTLLVFFSIILIYAAIGLFIGILSISNEELVPYIWVCLNIIIMLSCITYPKQVFPEIIQSIILLNPLYYIFDLLRLTWYLGVNYEVAMSYITLTHIIIFILMTIITPLISVYLFNVIYKKYGITGY